MARKTAVVGIDVSSKELHVALHGNDEVLTFMNTDAGHRQLCTFLKKRARQILVILESTGNYGLDVALHLHNERRIDVRYINPATAKAFARARLGRAKTDRIDAKLLAEMGAVLELPAWEPPSEHALALRTLTRRIRALVDDRTREKNRLQAARATQSTPRAVLDDLILHIDELDHRIDGLRRAAVALALEDPECAEHVRLLTTIQGIADATAVEILGELRCMPRDLTAKQAVAQAGLDPKANESGTKVGRRRISKMGSRRLRTALFIAATNVIKWSPAFRAHFDKLKESGKHTMVAKIAVARKLLHVCMGMLRTGTAFDPDLVRPRGSQSKQVA